MDLHTSSLRGSSICYPGILTIFPFTVVSLRYEYKQEALRKSSCSTDPAGLGGRLRVGEREHGVRGLHGGVRAGDAGHAAAALVRRAGRRLGRLRGRHRRQLLAHQHHPGRADHAREVHQRVWTAAAHAGPG